MQHRGRYRISTNNGIDSRRMNVIKKTLFHENMCFICPFKVVRYKKLLKIHFYSVSFSDISGDTSFIAFSADILYTASFFI
jgi:hypothetical protein